MVDVDCTEYRSHSMVITLSRKLARQTSSSSRLEQNEAAHEVKRVSKSGNSNYMVFFS